MDKKIDVIIPAAGLGLRFKSHGPKCLTPVGPDKEPIILRQIRLLRKTYNANIIVVLGFEADKIRKVLPKDVKVVVNDQYEDTNVARSISLALAKTPPRRPALIVYGDLVFEPETLPSLAKISTLLVERESHREDEVGVNICNDQVTWLSFGLASKWAQIAFLREKEKRLFCEIAAAEHRATSYTYEILNTIIDRTGQFGVAYCDKIFECDTPKSIDQIKVA